MIEPYKGRIYDPCCGSGGMFVQSEKFVEAHGGKVGDISIYGQESNPTTWKLCKMNLALRGIEGNMRDRNADTFHNDLHKDLKADFILANPPFNMSDWGGDRLREDTRWKYGTPPMSNANYAWVMHKIHHLAPNGIAGFCKSAKLEEIVSHGYVLTPGRYVGAEEVEDDDEAFEEKMLHLTKKLEQQFAESAKLEAIIKENLRGLGYGG